MITGFARSPIVPKHSNKTLNVCKKYLGGDQLLEKLNK